MGYVLSILIGVALMLGSLFRGRNASGVVYLIAAATVLAHMALFNVRVNARRTDAESKDYA